MQACTQLDHYLLDQRTTHDGNLASELDDKQFGSVDKSLENSECLYDSMYTKTRVCVRGLFECV